MTRKKIILLTCILTAMAGFFVGGLVLFQGLLISYVESRLIPRLAKEVGLEKLACEVRRIGFTGIDVGSLRIGDCDKPALTIDSIRLDYSVSGLIRSHIEKLVVGGMVLYCEFVDGKWTIRDLDVGALFAKLESKETATQKTERAFPPASFGVLELRNARIWCHRDGKQLGIPVDVEIVLKEKQGHASRCDLLMDVLGQKLFLVAHIGFDEKTVSLALDADSIDLDQFDSLAALILGLSVRGEGNFKGNARIGFDPWAVAAMSVSCELRNGAMTYEGLSLRAVPEDGSANGPCCIQYKSDGNEAKLYVSGVSIQSPVPLAVSEIRSTITNGLTNQEAKGNYTLTVGPIMKDSIMNEKGGVIIFPKALHWKGQYTAEVKKNGAWACSLGHGNIHPSSPLDLEIIAGGAHITSRLPDFNFNVKGTGGQGLAMVEAGISGLSARIGQKTRITTLLTGLKGGVNFQPSGELSARFTLDMSDSEINTESLLAIVPQVSLSGRLLRQKDRSMSVDGIFGMSDAHVQDPEKGIGVRDLKATVPFSWPAKGGAGKGSFLVGSMHWKRLSLGNVKGTIQQKGLELVFEGVHESALFPGFTTQFAGVSQVVSTRGNDTKVNFEIPPYTTPSPVDLGNFQPTLAGVLLNGSIKVQGSWWYDEKGTHGSLHGRLYDARLQIGDEQNYIDHLFVDVSAFDLGNFRSAPMQQVQFGKAGFGGVAITEGRIGFQIESLKSLFIEKGSVKWCGGNVYTEAIRVSSDSESYDVVLYGDRLNLADVLEQFGVARAQGQGTVNGRIPMRLGKGKIRFGDGFLFSTPGDGGTISLSGTEMLTAGIPVDTPQYVQMEMAREALKDFDYEWAKVTLATEEDNLVLKLQFDGKPAKPLPFVYKQWLGSFVKTKDGEQKSEFQGIRLDVNFRLPIDEILHYNNMLRKIFEADQ